jgi:uncharacterized coiled-coil protein SlyX
MTTLHIKNSIGRSLFRIACLLIPLVFTCLALSPTARALSPAPDGGYPNANTAEGTGALHSVTTGANNTALGSGTLSSLTTGSQNTATGSQALKKNTAIGNTADGFQALVNNTTGSSNVATGWRALFINTTGHANTATGTGALYSNTTGSFNTAVGLTALLGDTTGNDNTAVGAGALQFNIGGSENVAVGLNALNNSRANNNVALGNFAGFAQTTGSNNIYIGNQIEGSAGESNACYIGSIFNQTAAFGSPVLIDANSKLGTLTSSKRFKEDIKPMDKCSEEVFSLKPVTFRYKKEIDPAGTSQLGLVAEDVEKVNRDLVVRDKEGKPYSVRYDQVNAMLLNEFLKEHKTVQEQGATITQVKSTAAKQEATIERQQKQIEALTAGLQKVSAQLEAGKPAPQVVNNP